MEKIISVRIFLEVTRARIYINQPASMRKPLKTTGVEIPTNPTTANDTMYQYACIGLVALMHMLHDHPHHIRHRDQQRKTTASDAERYQHSRTSHTRPSRFSRSPPPPHSRYAESDRGYFTEERRPRRPETPPRPYHQTSTRTTSRSHRPSTPPLPRRSTHPPDSYRRASPPPLYRHVQPSHSRRPIIVDWPPEPQSHRPSPAPLRPRPSTPPSCSQYDYPSPLRPRVPRPSTNSNEPSRAQAHQAWTRIKGVTPSK
jgi:hypothetical protein